METSLSSCGHMLHMFHNLGIPIAEDVGEKEELKTC